jgi:hypothetical protein
MLIEISICDKGESMKRFDTTVNIKAEHRRRLEDGAAQLGVKVNALVVELFAAMLEQRERFFAEDGTVCYQNPSESGFETMHVYLLPHEYDQKIDMRRVYRMSASKVLGMAIDMFLDELIAGWYDNGGRCAFVNAQIRQNHDTKPLFFQNYAEFRLIWGPPPN